MRLTILNSLTPAAVLLALLSVGGCSGGKTVQANRSSLDDAVPVTVGDVIEKPMPVQLRVIGSVEAYSTVQVKSQIGGELMRVYFSEGQDVRKGDQLFEIDPRPYQQAVTQA